MEKSLKDRILNIYQPFVNHQPVNKNLLFSLYNELTGSKMKPSNCSTCLIKIKNAFESYLAENQ